MTRHPNVPEIDVHEAKRRVDEGDRFIDVREDDEYEALRIPGAVLIPLSEFMDRYRDELDADRAVVVHCRSGARSARVVQFLLQQGYDAVNVEGGILAWEEEGLPVARDAEEG